MTLSIALILTLRNAVSKTDLRSIKTCQFLKVRCPNSVNSFIESLKESLKEDVLSMLLSMEDSMNTDFGTNDTLPNLAFFEGQRA
jgi:hypothetical protein